MDDELELERNKRIFYEDFADGIFKFSCDQILNVQTAFLSAKSPVFHKLFMESSSNRVIEIRDYDFYTFKSFLDCLMDFQDCTVTDALLLFPIGWKYECKSFLGKCLAVLEPKELNENVCLALNLALCCKCEELQKKIIGFLDSEDLIYLIFHEEKYYSLLEPESVSKLLNYINHDSYVIKIVFKWGYSYLKKQNKSVDLKSFLLNNDIDIDYNGFESIQAVVDFSESELGKGFFHFEYIKSYLEYWGGDADLRTCSWFNLKAGETVTEKLVIKNFATLSDYNINVNVTRNRVIFYKSSKSEEMISYEYSYKVVNANNGSLKKLERKHFSEKIKTVFIPNFSLPWTISNIFNYNYMCNLEFEFKTSFHYDCRVLKFPPKNYDVIEPNPENLYFTNSITVELSGK